MTEKTANLFLTAVELNVIQNIKPFKSTPESPYLNFDVLGAICFSFEEALETAIRKIKEI